MFKNILVPIDGSALAQKAVKQACALAWDSGARLVFYYARPTYFPSWIYGETVMGNAGIDSTFLAAMQKHADELLCEAAQEAIAAHVDYATLSTENDAPHEGIIAAAQDKECDLIFMASHGWRGIKAMLLGSETQKVLTHCTIPVLVYR